MARSAILFAFLIFSATTPAQAVDDPALEAAFGRLSTPAPGPTRTVGRNTNGCILGAEALPLSGPGYRVVHPNQNRYWGHPDLIATIRGLGEAAAAQGLGLMLVADLGQPRGGPITGHGSHEVGLDADIRLNPWTEGELPAVEIADPTEVYYVDGARSTAVNSKWGAAQAALVRSAAERPEVERIFAHPAIKKAFCEGATGDRTWLGKVRAWYGHRAHFHIRLGCPVGSPDCVAQAPVPEGDGCGAELDWWFTDEPYAPGDPNAPKPEPPPLPAACTALLPR
ncbi:MAG: penicillin-insensitive murein endopeptidase [Rhodospirillaceae bacterium]|jgi:penicillin-insensitive murein DD-endopeptidase|nr:penicillin-insensitive murein endopeptidase [Rhodospirillaceae bacterium]MBT6119559.1 penicillin-insensitive murein endopeptidase [Rhodospirillaceae bacterium]